ncbi:hypothetical protein KDL01_03170 [Actinospica durhamensis]|uniref:Uncharacterized protein n=1 Tax=Actinospica durhamensis TaxID=1508375 RepID=A0A941INP0_9ACTN|nr:hypothetical protein [Actinospica durhamensis]MBR7832242.1 hypothetical protein [Actinospica durhamensis]
MIPAVRAPRCEDRRGARAAPGGRRTAAAGCRRNHQHLAAAGLIGKYLSFEFALNWYARLGLDTSEAIRTSGVL